MATKIFLDINVVIDFFDPHRAEHSNAVKLFSAIDDGKISAYVSESVVNTSVYLLRKQLTLKQLREVLSDILSLVKLLPCSHDIYLDSFSLAGNDLEDAFLYQLALSNRLDYFITEDKKDFRKFANPALPVISTKDFLTIND